jgi:hypothetical protein
MITETQTPFVRQFNLTNTVYSFLCYYIYLSRTREMFTFVLFILVVLKTFCFLNEFVFFRLDSSTEWNTSRVELINAVAGDI